MHAGLSMTVGVVDCSGDHVRGGHSGSYFEAPACSDQFSCLSLRNTETIIGVFMAGIGSFYLYSNVVSS